LFGFLIWHNIDYDSITTFYMIFQQILIHSFFLQKEFWTPLINLNYSESLFVLCLFWATIKAWKFTFWFKKEFSINSYEKFNSTIVMNISLFLSHIKVKKYIYNDWNSVIFSLVASKSQRLKGSPVGWRCLIIYKSLKFQMLPNGIWSQANCLTCVKLEIIWSFRLKDSLEPI